MNFGDWYWVSTGVPKITNFVKARDEKVTLGADLAAAVECPQGQQRDQDNVQNSDR